MTQRMDKVQLSVIECMCSIHGTNGNVRVHFEFSEDNNYSVKLLRFKPQEAIISKCQICLI